MTDKCKICGGNAGRLNENGNHWLCQTRREHNQPTPCLGMKCPDCNGSGTKGKGGLMLFMDIGPSKIKKAIDSAFPPCETCNGKGYK